MKIQKVKRRGRSPYYRVKVGGRDHYLGTDQAEAYRRAADLVKRAPMTDPLLVSQAVTEWVRLNQNPFAAECLVPWTTWCGTMELREVGRSHLEDYVRHLGKRKLSPSTIRKYVVYAKKVLAWAHDQGWLDVVPPAPKIPKALQRPRDYRLEDVRRALGKIPLPARNVIRFIVEQGCRPSEAVRLRWVDVDLDRRVATLSDHKSVARTGRPRTLYLTQGAYEVLSSLGGDREGFVFRNNKGRPYAVGGLRSILRRRGLPSVYALRHTAAQAWLDDGVPLEDIAKLLGHADLRTVQTYAQIRDNRARRVASGLSTLSE